MSLPSYLNNNNYDAETIAADDDDGSNHCPMSRNNSGSWLSSWCNIANISLVEGDININNTDQHAVDVETEDDCSGGDGENQEVRNNILPWIGGGGYLGPIAISDHTHHKIMARSKSDSNLLQSYRQRNRHHCIYKYLYQPTAISKSQQRQRHNMFNSNIDGDDDGKNKDLSASYYHHNDSIEDGDKYSYWDKFAFATCVIVLGTYLWQHSHR